MMLRSFRLRWPLGQLLLLVALCGGLFAWWRSDPFEGSIRAVVQHGGAVAYDERWILVSFAPWMPSAPENWSSQGTGRFVHSKDVVPSDLGPIHPHLRTMAEHRERLQVEFSDDAQARAAQAYFEALPHVPSNVKLIVHRPGSSTLHVRF